MLRLSRWEYLGLALFGLLMWAYVLIRIFEVFYVTDELVTKWAYMVPWNFWPYAGYVDANNHFLLSFLGGLFIRIFQSDAMAVVRMPVALSFLLYAWSTLQLGRYFKARWSLYGFYVLLLSCPFFLEFFGLARGYGLSLAMLMWGLWKGRAYLATPRRKLLWVSALALMLAVCANLTLLPLVGLALLLLGLHAWWQKPAWSISLLPFGLILLGLVKYSFDLRTRGKLYYGFQEGLIRNTLHSLTDMVLGSTEPVVKYLWFWGMIALLGAAFYHFYRRGWKPDGRYLFPAFLALSLLNILGQHYLLGINFPANRTAIYLALAFLGALVATLDLWKVSALSLLASLGMLGVLAVQFNFTHTHTFKYEHFDPKLATQIPRQVAGLPPITGARFWGVDNAMNRHLNDRILAFQDVTKFTDTLYDYVTHIQESWAQNHPRYEVVYQDSISGRSLYRRRPFLKRQFVETFEKSISGKEQFMSLWKSQKNTPHLIRLNGYLDSLDIYSRIRICITLNQQESGKSKYMGCLLLIANKQTDAKQRLKFDFSLAVPAASDGQEAKVYIWNKRKQPLSGKIKVESYRLGKPSQD